MRYKTHPLKRLLRFSLLTYDISYDMLYAMQTISALQFRQNFGSVLDQAVVNGPMLVKRQNVPIVIIYPYKERGRDILTLEAEEPKDNLAARMDAWREKYGQPQKGVKDSVTLIREMRDNRYGKKWLKTGTHY